MFPTFLREYNERRKRSVRHDLQEIIVAPTATKPRRLVFSSRRSRAGASKMSMSVAAVPGWGCRSASRAHTPSLSAVFWLCRAAAVCGLRTPLYATPRQPQPNNATERGNYKSPRLEYRFPMLPFFSMGKKPIVTPKMNEN